ncbi:hypothetical protein ACKWTF_010572 [Chironomus riparius]
MQIFFRTVPIHLWFLTIWSVSKIVQYIFNQQQTVWEMIWQRSIDYYEQDKYKLFEYGILVTSTATSVIVLSIYSFFDFTQKPAFIRKYKINPNTNEPPDSTKFIKVISYSVINVILAVIPTTLLAYYGLKWRGIPSLYPLPNILTVLITCFINDHIFDVSAYTTHRIMHHRLLYKHIHKIHHEYKSTIAVAAFHSHPVEHLLVNLLPLVPGIVIMKCHIATAWIYLIGHMLSSFITHSGYHLPFLNSPEYHDFHHMKFECNYSVLGLMDWIFGTDKLFNNTIYHKRDKILFSLKSAHELYPKEDGKVVKTQ